MYIDEKRLERQIEGRNKWVDNNYNGIFNYTTGVGKTFTTILCIEYLEELVKDSYIIIVPGLELENQWKNKLKDFPKYLLDRILIKTANKILNEDIKYEVGTKIIDEIHEFSSEERLKLIGKDIVKSNRFLGLTASGDDKNFWKILKFYPIIDTITQEEAKEKGFIAEYLEYNVALSFTPKEKEKYDNYTVIINSLLPRFNNNLTLAQKVLQGGKDNKNIYYSPSGWAMGLAYNKGWNNEMKPISEATKAILSLWTPQLISGYATRLINAVRYRKELLYKAESKYIETIKLLKKFDKVKTIVFTESTTFADELYKKLKEEDFKVEVIHSKLKTIFKTSEKSGKLIKFGAIRQRKEALNNIIIGKSRILITTKVGDKGLDIPDIRFSIATSGTQSTTQYTQRRGRPTRKEIGTIYSDIPVLLVNLFIKETQDEIWLNNRTSNSVQKALLVDSIDNITYSPANNIEFNFKDI